MDEIYQGYMFLGRHHVEERWQMLVIIACKPKPKISTGHAQKKGSFSFLTLLQPLSSPLSYPSVP